MMINIIAGVILSLGVRCAGAGLLWSIGCGNWQISSVHSTSARCLPHLEWQVRFRFIWLYHVQGLSQKFSSSTY